MGHSRHHRRRRTKRKRRMCTQKVAFHSELAAMRVGAAVRAGLVPLPLLPRVAPHEQEQPAG